MIAKFFAQRIIDKDTMTTFTDVPELLKEQVRDALIVLDYGYLAQVEDDK